MPLLGEIKALLFAAAVAMPTVDNSLMIQTNAQKTAYAAKAEPWCFSAGDADTATLDEREYDWRRWAVPLAVTVGTGSAVLAVYRVRGR